MQSHLGSRVTVPLVRGVAAAVLVAAVGVTVQPAPLARAASTVKVCTPKKCVTVPVGSYCAPSKAGCTNGSWQAVTGYCSPSVGCVTIDGKNYRWVGTGLTAVNNINPTKCAASLGISVASIYYGVNWPSVAGVAVSIWGCTP